MKSDPYIVFGAPRITETEIEAVAAVLRSRWIGSGPVVEEFERRFGSYTGSPEAVAVSSCSTGLFLVMKALGIGPGDEVITTDMTFCATVNAVLHTGAVPVIVDCDRETMNIPPEGIDRAIGRKTRAIVPVHIAGAPCRMESIVESADRHRLKVIEDCAHAVEATVGDRHCGTLGDAGCFSFYATKNVTSGEGGMITTGDAELAAQLAVLRNHGLTKDAWARHGGERTGHYDAVAPGYKANLTDMQAALALAQLERVDENREKRERLWRRYRAELSGLPLSFPAGPPPGSRHAYHLFTILLDLDRLAVGRDEFRRILDGRGVGTGVHYRAIHEHSYYRDTLRLPAGRFPHAAWISERTVSLPFSPALTGKEVERVLAAVRSTLKEETR